jgi:hypothetical protein
LYEPGAVSKDGSVSLHHFGSLKGRSGGPWVRLVESERRDDDFDSFENDLYMAAVQAGWVAIDGQQSVGEVQDADILVCIPRYSG